MGFSCLCLERLFKLSIFRAQGSTHTETHQPQPAEAGYHCLAACMSFLAEWEGFFTIDATAVSDFGGCTALHEHCIWMRG